MSIVHNTKDKIISRQIRNKLDIKIKEYGNVTDFIINSKDKTILLKILLKGENQFTEIFVSDFEIIMIDDKTWFSFAALHTSKEWLNMMIKNRLIKSIQNNRVEIPEKYAYVAQLLFST